MADQQDTAVLDFLREQFARMDARFDRMERLQRETLTRLARIEDGVTKLRRDQADDAAAVMDVQHRVDRMGERLDRIERRLDLSDQA